MRIKVSPWVRLTPSVQNIDVERAAQTDITCDVEHAIAVSADGFPGRADKGVIADFGQSADVGLRVGETRC